MFVIGGGRLEKQLVELVTRLQEHSNNGLEKIKNYLDLSKEVDSLREQKAHLAIEKSQIEEKYQKREREIEHKLGLERERQKQELELSKREATVTIREENLQKDRERFSSEMEFVTKRFEKETGYLKDMIAPLLEALPKMTIKQEIGSSRKR